MGRRGKERSHAERMEKRAVGRGHAAGSYRWVGGNVHREVKREPQGNRNFRSTRGPQAMTKGRVSGRSGLTPHAERLFVVWWGAEGLGEAKQNVCVYPGGNESFEALRGEQQLAGHMRGP